MVLISRGQITNQMLSSYPEFLGYHFQQGRVDKLASWLAGWWIRASSPPIIITIKSITITMIKNDFLLENQDDDLPLNVSSRFNHLQWRVYNPFGNPLKWCQELRESNTQTDRQHVSDILWSSYLRWFSPGKSDWNQEKSSTVLDSVMIYFINERWESWWIWYLSLSWFIFVTHHARTFSWKNSI